MSWDREDKKVVGWILVLSPKPGAYTYHEGRRVKLIRARTEREVPEIQPRVSEAGTPGEVLEVIPPLGILVATGSGHVVIEEVQPENRPSMDALSYANGYGLKAGDVFRETSQV